MAYEYENFVTVQMDEKHWDALMEFVEYNAPNGDLWAICPSIKFI